MRGERVLELLAWIASGTAAWILADRMGSVRNVLDDTGAVIDTIDYDGYGNNVNETNPVNGGLYKYDGYRTDKETGLLRPDPTRGRYYNPSLAQWMNVDPFGFAAGDANPYRYVYGNSLNICDPSRLDVKRRDPIAECNKGHDEYCDSAKAHPANQWLQCVCKVSGLICTAAKLLLNAPNWPFSRTPSWRDKGMWLINVNACIFGLWKVGIKYIYGNEEERRKLRPTDDWKKAGECCVGKDGAEKGKKCCEAMVVAEQSAIDKCIDTPRDWGVGKIPPYKTEWGGPYTGPFGESEFVEKWLGAGDHPKWEGDFTKLKDCVAHGIKLCCKVEK